MSSSRSDRQTQVLINIDKLFYIAFLFNYSRNLIYYILTKTYFFLYKWKVYKNLFQQIIAHTIYSITIKLTIKNIKRAILHVWRIS